MGVDQLKELRRLQKENERLRRAVSDLTLDNIAIMSGAMTSCIVAPMMGNLSGR
ncbi:hypothetical protein [Ruegeria atlantica]